MNDSKIPRFRWCRSEQDARSLARLFYANLTPGYISHGELQGPRARTAHEWADDISDVLMTELLQRVETPLDPPPGGETQLAAALDVGGSDQGVFLVTFSRKAPVPFCILEDIVIDGSLRSSGLGSAYIDWITGECRARGIGRLFLESGKDNARAHAFFERQGFEAVSIVMMKQL